MLLAHKFFIILVCVFISIFSKSFALEVKDNFSKDNLNDTKRYALFGHGVSVQQGALRLEAQENENPFVNFFPVFGKNSQMEFSARVVRKDDRAALMLYADWRYRNAGPYIGIYVLFDSRNYVTFFNGASGGASYHFEAGKYYRFKVIRTEQKTTQKIKLLINEKEILTADLPHKGNDVYSALEENNYGGYGLAVAKDPGHKIIEVDDLHLSGDKANVEYAAHVKKFSLNNQPHTYTVVYRNGYLAWAKNQAEEAVPFLQFTTEVYGVLPIQKVLSTAQAFGEYFAAGNGFNSGGVNIQTGALNSTQRGWGLNCHELGHNWQHLYAKRFNTEGSADLACYLWFEHKNNSLWHTMSMLPDETTRQAILQNKFKDLPLDDDAPFNFSGMPTPQLAVAAHKARVFTYMLYKILGAQKYRQMHQIALKQKTAMSSQDMQNYAEQAYGGSLQQIFRGWVFAGGKAPVSIKDAITDSDGDGLSDLDEWLYGTKKNLPDSDNDGYGDLGEILAGYNPADAKSFPSGSIIIDAKDNDWSKIPVTVVDADQNLNDSDIAQVKIFVEKNSATLYALISYHRPFTETPAVKKEAYITFDFHRSPEQNIDYRLNVFYGAGSSGLWKTSGHNHYGKTWDPDKWQALPSPTQFTAGYGQRQALLEISLDLKPFLEYHNNDFYITITGKDQFLSANPIKISRQSLATEKKAFWWPKPKLK